VSDARKKPNRQWTAAENNIIAALYEDGVKPSQIACRIGATREQIEAKIKKWGLVRKFRAPSVTAAYRSLDTRLSREAQFAELLSQGFTVAQIGEAMGYKDYASANAAFQRLRQHMGEQAA
jgi:hypothetical protein